MSKKTNETKNPLKKWYITKKSKLDPIARDDDKYFINILSNSLYRIILSVFSGIGIFFFDLYSWVEFTAIKQLGYYTI